MEHGTEIMPATKALSCLFECFASSRGIYSSYASPLQVRVIFEIMYILPWLDDVRPIIRGSRYKLMCHVRIASQPKIRWAVKPKSFVSSLFRVLAMLLMQAVSRIWICGVP